MNKKVILNPEIAIEAKNISMKFRSYSQKIDSLKEFFIYKIKGRLKHKDFLCLDNVSFSIKRGENVAIIGRNGAGKSTLLKILCGILSPTAGNITTNGKLTPLLRLGAGFDSNDTGINNIYLNGAIMGFTKKEIASREQEIIDFAELGNFIYEPIKNYSSGMLARLGFSIAMSLNPDIILVDEILAVGDGAFQKKCHKRFEELKNKSSSLIMVTHSQNFSNICERAIWLKDGKIEMDDDSKIVIAEYKKFLDASAKA